MSSHVQRSVVTRKGPSDVKRLSAITRYRELTVFLLMILFALIVGVVNGSFLTVNSLNVILNSSIVLLLMAIGESFVLIAGEIDVSVGSIIGISAAVAGMGLMHGESVGMVILLTLLTGLAAGVINGLGVSFLKIPAIIMTLGTMGIIRGIMIMYTGGKWIEDIPKSFKSLSTTTFLGLSVPVWMGFICLILTFLFLSRSRVGRYFYAVGDNADGAKLIGIPVQWMKLIAFSASGVAAAIAGLVFVMNIGFVPNDTGSGMELEVIAAAVLGGVSLSGGIGSVVGAGLGAIFFTMIESSLVYLKIPGFWNNAISGLLLLVIVLIDYRLQSLSGRSISLFKKRPASSDSSLVKKEA